MFEDLTWTCHICKDRRPDEKISVYKHDRSKEYDMSPGTMVENVRYCNDKLECIEAAKDYSHFKRNPENHLVFGNNHDDSPDSARYLFHVDDDDTLPSKNRKNNNVMKHVANFVIFLVLISF